MTQNINKMLESLIDGNLDDAKKHISKHIQQVASKIISETTQQDMFGASTDRQTQYRYLVMPIGVGYDDEQHAIAAAKNHPNKSVHVIDTENDSVVYSHKGKRNK